MATAAKPKTIPMPEIPAQMQEIGERLFETSKKAAGEYLNLAEKAAQTVVEFEREVAGHTDVEWFASLINAQADLTGDITKVWVSTGRELVK